jgi:hypothetical protein
MGATLGNLKTAREMHQEKTTTKVTIKVKTPHREKAESIHGFPPVLLLLRR